MSFGSRFVERNLADSIDRYQYMKYTMTFKYRLYTKHRRKLMEIDVEKEELKR